MPRPKPQLNPGYGRWTVVGEPFTSGRHLRVRARCLCGIEKDVLVDNLMSGTSTSCGCVCVDQVRDRFTTHGRSGEPLYYVWKAMLARCENEATPGFKNYGGCGISVCEEWHDLNVFMAWAAAGYKPGLSIERKDVDGNYEPGNCRWATRSEQNQNRRPAPGKSGFVGVYLTPSGRFEAKFRRKLLGLFDDPVSAALARDNHVRVHGYKHATLNGVADW